MKRPIGSVLLSCVVGAALLGGCAAAIPPAASGVPSGSAVQSEQETEEVIFGAEDVNQFETYFQILASYVYEPCTKSELASHQIIDPAIFICARSSENVPDVNGVIVLDEQDVAAWAEKLFESPLDFDQLGDEHAYSFYIGYDKENHTVAAHSFTDTVAVRGYGIDTDDLDFQTEGQTLYVIAPVLKIEDRGIWEPYQTLRYEFALNRGGDGTLCYLLQNVTAYA